MTKAEFKSQVKDLRELHAAGDLRLYEYDIKLDDLVSEYLGISE